jgi:hypothetical protein
MGKEQKIQGGTYLLICGHGENSMLRAARASSSPRMSNAVGQRRSQLGQGGDRQRLRTSFRARPFPTNRLSLVVAREPDLNSDSQNFESSQKPLQY